MQDTSEHGCTQPRIQESEQHVAHKYLYKSSRRCSTNKNFSMEKSLVCFVGCISSISIFLFEIITCMNTHPRCTGGDFCKTTNMFSSHIFVLRRQCKP